MKSLKKASLLLALILTACSSSDDGQNANTYQQIDNPMTRMNAVLNHGAFSQLVQEPRCTADALDIELFEADLSNRGNQRGQRVRDSRGSETIVRLFIDSRAGLLTIIEPSIYGRFAVKKTSHYAISQDGNALVIQDYGVIELGRRGTLTLRIPATQVRETLVRTGRRIYDRGDSRFMNSSAEREMYFSLCGRQAY